MKYMITIFCSAFL